MVSKSYWFWVAVIVAAGVLVFFVRFDLPESRASLVINFENGASRKFEGPVETGMTVIQAVFASSIGGQFEVKYHIDLGGNVNLASIDKFINIGGREWRFSLNGRPISTSDLDRIKVRRGDLIEARYE